MSYHNSGDVRVEAVDRTEPQFPIETVPGVPDIENPRQLAIAFAAGVAVGAIVA